MVCGLLLKPEFKDKKRRFMWRSLLSYIDLTVSRAMGCFFACFRGGRDSDRRRSPPPTTNLHLSTCSSSSEAKASRNRLSSLFLAEAREDSGHSVDKKENISFESPQINKELVDEAKFLKACGTLVETPIEIRKASLKLRTSPSVDKAAEPSYFHSWLPHASINKTKLAKQSGESPASTRRYEELEMEARVSLEKTPSSCISSAQSPGRISLNSTQIDKASSISPATDIHRTNKSVHFECDFDESSSEGPSSGNVRQTSVRLESSGDLSVSRPSPKPTPLKISDEMQTPGTVFPGNVDMLGNGKSRIRSQYVFSTSDPLGNDSQLQVLKEDDPTSLHLPGEVRGSLVQTEGATPESDSGLKDTFAMKDETIEASLSPWLKQQQSVFDKDNPSLRSAGNFQFGFTPGDRPIIGMVAAHWIEHEATQVSPKWWDGNGIPNSTNKYKEDQKVSWHATPFEERLEKALSEESMISQKMHVNGRPRAFDECDESDTAVSKLRETAQTKSVVSY